MEPFFTRRILAVCTAVTLLAGCASQPQAGESGMVPSRALAPQAAAATAYVNYWNQTSRPAKLYVEWSYPFHVWHVAHEACVAPNSEWKTTVDYENPNSRPQLRIYARVTEKADCSNVFSLATRFVRFEDLTFKDGRAMFSAEIFYDSKAGYVLCARGDGFQEKCDAYDGYPSLRARPVK